MPVCVFIDIVSVIDKLLSLPDTFYLFITCVGICNSDTL